ncbi:MAG: C10 family peptidase, partial [Bacteroidales bacterium]|nr:C10 family peptidase [Bacteroidales bacterium]
MKKYVVFFVLTMSMLTAYAQSIDYSVSVEVARSVGMKFFNANTNKTLHDTNVLALVDAYTTTDGVTAFYVFGFEKGFVLVSADRRSIPILGFSNEGSFDVNHIPAQMQAYLQDFVDQIEYARKNDVEPDSRSLQRWEQVNSTGRMVEPYRNGQKLSNCKVSMMRDGHIVEISAMEAPIVRPAIYAANSTNGVGPLVTAQWDQNCFYNAMCPEDMNGACGHTPTGCVATAMGMIMHYWGYPAHGRGSHSYISNESYPTQTVNFGTTVYDWANMLNQLTSTS